ncbi:MAG: cytochrome b [Alphaproteobacteria bacterium]|nr:cytochrome b [Alphaproteobacteria bacterium]
MTQSITRYHVGAMILHWLMAVLILGNLVLGLLLEDIPNDQKFQFYQLHKSIGITVLVLAVLRVVWRFLFPAPALPASLKSWEVWAVKITHFMFYVLMVGIPFSGWALVSASPKKIPTFLFGIIPLPHLPFFDGVEDLAARKELSESISEVHELLAYALLALLALHIAAALRHHWILKDETMLRMTPKWCEGLLQKLRGRRV